MRPASFSAALLSVMLFVSCGDSLLTEQNFSELGPSNFFRTEADAVATGPRVGPADSRVADARGSGSA
jgi:hypothetical protein